MTDRHLGVVTPWYPTPDRPYHGVFVRQWIRALGWAADEVTVVHLSNVPPGSDTGVVRLETPEGRVVRIPVPVAPRTPRAVTAELQRDALRRAWPTELDEATAVHAHVGHPSGWAVAAELPPRTRLVTTEHASYLPRVLRRPDTAEQYAALLARSERLITVGEGTARAVRARFPDQAEKVEAWGNPVDLAKHPFVGPRTGPLERWLYVGNLVREKGLDRLVRSFAAWVSLGHPRASLTLVGDGSMRDAILARARELDVADRVTLRGALPPDEVAAAHHESDVLVHLSHHETFGLSVLEAALAGLAVLVTECGGPEETLLPAVAAGSAAFVPVGDAVAPVVAGVERLSATLPTADTVGVRAVLSARYGAESIGARLGDLLDGRTDPGPDTGPDTGAATGDARRGAVLVVAPTWTAATRARPVVDELVRRGGQVGLVTARRADVVETDRRVLVHDVSRVLARTPAHWPEAALVGALRAAAVVAAAVATLLRRLPWARRTALRLHTVAGRLERGTDHPGLHRRVDALYARTDARALARAVDGFPTSAAGAWDVTFLADGAATAWAASQPPTGALGTFVDVPRDLRGPALVLWVTARAQEVLDAP